MSEARARWRPRVRGTRRWLWLAALSVPSCAVRQAAPGPVPSANQQPAAAPAPSFGASARLVEAKGQGVEFPLPDASGWRWDKRERHSWVARHLRTSSELVVRAWRLDGIARPEDCEREARLFRSDLPHFTPAEIIADSERLLAGSFRGRVTVGVRTAPAPAERRWLGNVIGFGSDARDCLLLSFSTSAVGPSAREIIAERLGTMAGSVFERARRLEIEARVSVPRL